MEFFFYDKGRLLPLKSREKSRVLKSQEKKQVPTCIVCSTKGHSEVARLFGKSRIPICDMCTSSGTLGPNSFLDFLKSHDSGESPGIAVPR